METTKNVKTHSDMGGRREENEAEIVNAAIQLDSHGPSSFLYTSMMLSVSPISFESFFQDIVLWWILISVLLPNESNQPLVDNLIPKKFSWLSFFFLFYYCIGIRKLITFLFLQYSLMVSHNRLIGEHIYFISLNRTKTSSSILWITTFPCRASSSHFRPWVGVVHVYSVLG